MDALKSITNTVPTWLTRLDDLTEQIDKSQLELAELAELAEKQTSPRSVRNRGSTESLKPKNDDEDHPMTAEPPVENKESPEGSPNQRQAGCQARSSADLQKQSHIVARARARAMMRRKMKMKRTSSVISGEEGTPQYRSLTMVIIYYDSYVQSFFEELVKFVSASRNMIRKAKMAAKVAQVRKLADLEMPDDSPSKEGSEGQQPGAPLLAADPTVDGPEEPLPPLRYMSSRRMVPISRNLGLSIRSYGRGVGLGTLDDKPDIYDDLDKGLEYVQGRCEHSAHKFLREGHCNEEIGNIQSRLAKTRDLAQKELDRFQREEGASTQPGPEEPPKYRAFKAPSMRKTTHKEDSIPNQPPSTSPTAPTPAADTAPTAPTAPPNKEPLTLEVDDDADDGNNSIELPKLVYRSTRGMRTRR